MSINGFNNNQRKITRDLLEDTAPRIAVARNPEQTQANSDKDDSSEQKQATPVVDDGFAPEKSVSSPNETPQQAQHKPATGDNARSSLAPDPAQKPPRAKNAAVRHVIPRKPGRNRKVNAPDEEAKQDTPGRKPARRKVRLAREDAPEQDQAPPATDTPASPSEHSEMTPAQQKESEPADKALADAETLAMDALAQSAQEVAEALADKETLAMDALANEAEAGDNTVADPQKDATREDTPEKQPEQDQEQKTMPVPSLAQNATTIPASSNGHHTTFPVEVLNGKTHGKSPAKWDRQRVPEVSKESVAVLVPPSRPGTLMPGEYASLRRVRINRILMHKRHRERFYKELAPRIVTIFAALLIVITTFLSSGAGAAYAYYQSQLPLLDGIAQHSMFQTTRIYDRNGKLLYELYDQQVGRGRRTYVNYNDISQLLVNATIAAEDRTFWTNSGVDLQGIARAFVLNAQNNEIVGGGSTITQQLIKKQLFDNEPRTYQQKLREATLAAGLTQQYPKWKIMEMYLNTVYYGDINYGVEEAARDYFRLKPQCDKTHCKPVVSRLTLGQASMLAGLPQSPTYYNPIVNKSVALQRQEIVLQSMLEMKMITPQQKAAAQKEMQDFKFQPYSDTHQMQAPHFVRYLIDQVLVPLLGAQNLVDGGYNIYTTIDLDLEKKVEQIVHDQLYLPQNDNYIGYHGPLSSTHNVNNGAAVVMDPATGEILAMDGSADYNQNTPEMQGQFNAAISPRQPGSSIKPIVYATAFEMGWYPAMILPDHKTTYPVLVKAPNEYYAPQNYDQKYHTGFPMTVRNALANSFNIPAVDTIEFTGIQNVLNTAGRLGLSEIANLKPENLGPSMALGSKEVSLLHLTDAYAAFANQGMRISPISILQISDNQGNVLYKYDSAHPKGVQAVHPDVAFLISSILSDKAARYHEFFPGNPLELPDRPAAAKTGTTDSFRDNWTVGYTPHLAVGVWAGNSNNATMNNVIGITGAGPIWNNIMEYASKRYNFPPDDFVRPPNVHQGTVSALTGLLPRPGEPTVTDWFIDGTMPTIQGTPVFQCQGDHCNNNNDNNNNDNNNNDNNNNNGDNNGNNHHGRRGH